MIKVRASNASYIEDAAKLFSISFDEARKSLPLIPARPDIVLFTEKKLEKIADNPGFAAFDDERFVGYMIELFTKDSFMGRPTGFIIDFFPIRFSSMRPFSRM